LHFAVISLRQLERQLERNKEKLATDTAQLQHDHDLQIAKLKTKLNSLQSENNLLMVSILQFGILSWLLLI
jgi:hypothetical protein